MWKIMIEMVGDDVRWLMMLGEIDDGMVVENGWVWRDMRKKWSLIAYDDRRWMRLSVISLGGGE